jgi:hypothetical protein
LYCAKALVAALLLAVLTYCSRGNEREIARNHSPDKFRDAVIHDVGIDAAGRRGVRVCLQSSHFGSPQATPCVEVAYISGFKLASDSVYTFWRGSGRLEVHYPHADEAHLYKSVYMPGGTYRSGTYNSYSEPVFITLVPSDHGRP